jgi:predicted nucleic acid-binding protein
MPRLPKIYIDSCSLIDLLKFPSDRGPEDGGEINTWYVNRLLEASRNEEIEMYTSTLSIAECTNVGDESRLEEAKMFFRHLFETGKSGVILIQATRSVMAAARELLWTHGLHFRGADSVHVASALQLGCDELITNDDKILKAAPHLKALNLHVCQGSQTSYLPARYMQGTLFKASNADKAE